jgi:hypothetical protein
MKLSFLFTLNAIVAAVFGIAFVVAPNQSMGLYGVEPNALSIYLGRLLGGSYIAFAIMTWSARNAGDSDARRAIVMSLCIGFFIGFIVALIGQIGQVVNALGWLTVVLYLFFSLGYAMSAFGKKGGSAPMAS